MNIEYVRKKERLYCQGNELLIYSLDVPVFEGAQEINSFYSSIVDECEKYCKGELFDRLCAEVGRKRYSYRLVCKVTYADTDVASVIIFACLRSGKQSFQEYVNAHTWELGSMLLLPPEYVWRWGKGDKKVKKEDLEGVFIDEGKVKNIREVDIADLLSSSRDK